jgi:PAS domain S-box-containing protein
MERKRLETDTVTPLPQGSRATWMPAGTSPAATGSDVLKRYGLALVLAGLALLVRALLPVPQGASIYQLPIAAVVLSAWYGGRGPGLLASVVCVTGSLYLFLPPQYSFELSSAHRLPFSIFIGLCLLLSEFSAGRKRVEGELRASEERFRTFVDRATDAFFLLNERLEVVDVNRQACESMGWSREELIGMQPRQFDVSLDQSSIERLSQRASAGETITFETRHRRKDGSAFPVEIRTGTFKDGGKLFYLAIARDISERKLAEETLLAKESALETARTELARVSRLTTLGELTTSIAHEVGQPLGAMVASAGACTRWLAATPPAMADARAALDNIVADGKRAREVIARIRALAKRQGPREEWLDINQEIVEVLALTEHELRSHDIVLRTDLGRTLPHVAGDRVQLQQVLLNLIMNAVEAMSGVRDRSRELAIVSRLHDPDAVLVEVRDFGTGVEAQDAERVFEAFYTTKTEGVGIGLSISRSIIEAHGGRLWASANSPHGAVFSFSLPVTAEVVA